MTEPRKKVSPLRGEGRGDRTEGGRVVTDNAAGAASAGVPKGKIGGLSIYRMQLLGTEGLQRYRETGYIPDDLID